MLPLSGTTSLSAVPLSFGVLDAGGDPAGIGGLVQVIPAEATITGIAGRFTNSVATTPLDPVFLWVQLYTGAPGSNVLNAAGGASCLLMPVPEGPWNIGNVSWCSTTGLNIPVPANSTAVVVMRASSPTEANPSLTGHMSASVTAS